MDIKQLLNTVHQIYLESDTDSISNEQLYSLVSERCGIDAEELTRRSEIGVKKEKHCVIKRKIRWYQQTLKMLNVIERVDGERGVWRLAKANKGKLHEAPGGIHLLAFSTALGVGLWADSRSVFSNGIHDPIHLVMTSPPFPLRVSRRYGNEPEKAWVSWLIEMMEPLVKQLAPGGSIVLELSNDIFEHKSPSRSLYLERMVLAMHDDLGLSLMDRIPWVNTSKPPTPTIWACRERVQLCAGWEPIYWFTNDPSQVYADNRRVLQPHTEAHQKFLLAGNQRVASYGDGAYRLRAEKSFSNQTAGRIPKNVYQRGHRCSDTLELRRHAQALELPCHSAVFPTWLPEQVIQFLTEPGQLVVDPFAGWFKTALAAERHGRRWFCVERVLEHVRVALEMFRRSAGFWSNPDLIRGC